VKILDTFTSFIAIDHIDVDNLSLEKYCKDQIYNSEHYTTLKETQSNLLDLNSPELKDLITQIENKINRVHMQVGLSPEYSQKVSMAWTNLNDPKETRQPHHHAECVFSCVYYVKGNDTSGDIEFMTPVVAKGHVFTPKHIAHYNKFTASEYHFSPAPGRLIIFPSWLYHYVNPNKSNEERISIAFNTVFEKLL
jgi:uncharacterized protein (TIGR02466 family)